MIPQKEARFNLIDEYYHVSILAVKTNMFQRLVAKSNIFCFITAKTNMSERFITKSRTFSFKLTCFMKTNTLKGT